MIQIFIDPAMSSTGIFAVRDESQFFFFNPRISFKAGATLPLKYRNVKIMLSLVNEILSRLLVEGEETEIYVEQTFVGRNPSGLELSGLSFLLIDRILRLFKTKLYGAGSLRMISSGMISGKDKKAKRERKERKTFAIEQFAQLYATTKDPKVFGRETLSFAGHDDVATAFLFWFYLFGPGKEEKPKNQPVLLEIPLEYYENSMTTGDDDGQE